MSKGCIRGEAQSLDIEPPPSTVEAAGKAGISRWIVNAAKAVALKSTSFCLKQGREAFASLRHIKKSECLGDSGTGRN